MEDEIFLEAKKQIEIAVAKFAIEFEHWLEPIGDIRNIIKILPKHIIQVGNAVIKMNENNKIVAFLTLIALYRGYLYSDYFINKGCYSLGEHTQFDEYEKNEIMEEVLNGSKEGDNLALKLDIFFHILVDNSIHIHEDSIQQEAIEQSSEISKQQMILGLLIRFAEIKIATKTNRESLLDRINHIVCLQPNIFGFGINFNKLISFLKKN